MKRVIALVCAAATVATVAGFDRAQAVPGAPAVAAFTPTLATWHDCGSLECSTLTVPLDYANPDNGKTVKLAVTRLAADPAAGAYAGIMVGNPGGPGAPGRSMPFVRDDVPGTAALRYDWIGFDPRGVGASTPALHCDTSYFGPDRPSYVPTTKRLMRFWLRKTSRYAAACGRSSAKALLPFMTSRDTVMDLESLRVAAQALAPAAKKPAIDKLNYIGFSFGTYLGEAYATMYSDRVGRFVLDSVVDPNAGWYRTNLQQDIAFDKNLNAFLRWVAHHNGTFHLGTKPGRLRAAYNAMVKKLAKHPAAGGKLGPDELADAMLAAGYDVSVWPSVAFAYASLVRRHRGGALYAAYASSSYGSANENLYAVYNAVQCTDSRRPAWKTQVRDTWRVHAKHPFLAWDNTWYNAPCLTWPAPSRAPIVISGSALAALGTRILLINETRDGATPYGGALNARALFPTASLIAGVGGTTHVASLRGIACVDNRIATYLANGSVPGRQAGRRADVSCPHVLPPAVNGRSARIADLPQDSSSIRSMSAASMIR